MAQAHGPLVPAGGRVEGKHEGGRLCLLGELVPLARDAEPQVVHPSGQDQIGRRRAGERGGE